MGERVGERRGQGCGVCGAHGEDEKGAVLEGLTRVVEEVERGGWLRAEPAGEERFDQRGSGGIVGQCVVVAGDGGDEHWVGRRSGLAGRAVCDEEAERTQAERLGIEEGRGDAGRNSGGQIGVVADGREGLAAAAEEGGIGRVAGYSTARRRRTVAADWRRRARPTAWKSLAPSPRKTGGAETGNQRTLPNPRRAVPPVWLSGLVSAMESQSALRAWSPGAPMRSSRTAEGGTAPE